MKRKPDFENESFRAWNPTEKEKKEERSSEIKIKLDDDTEFGLCGFKVIRNKKKSPMFAFKVKIEEGMGCMLYHIFEENVTESEFEKYMEIVRLTQEEFNLNAISVMDSFKSIQNEKHVFEKWSEDDKKK